MATLPDILRFIAREEPLVRTLGRVPHLSRSGLEDLLTRVADLPEVAALAVPARPAEPPPPPPKPAAAPGHKEHAPKARRYARVFSDGASRGNPGMAGAGAVILDEKGEVVERLKRFLGKQTNNIAEYEGALLGIRRAQELGIREIDVVADSQLLIRQLGGQYRVKNEGIRPLYEAAMQLLRSFDKVRLIHVPREQNTLADEMSNRAIDER
jgi:ribonuclease HI